jgi:hypothetical protein
MVSPQRTSLLSPLSQHPGPPQTKGPLSNAQQSPLSLSDSPTPIPDPGSAFVFGLACGALGGPAVPAGLHAPTQHQVPRPSRALAGWSWSSSKPRLHIRTQTRNQPQTASAVLLAFRPPLQRWYSTHHINTITTTPQPVSTGFPAARLQPPTNPQKSNPITARSRPPRASHRVPHASHQTAGHTENQACARRPGTQPSPIRPNPRSLP